ncbi:MULTISPECIES: hypothetical protein [Arthrobacter]|uniref:YCII-related domain-containing protein n=1 Tax=Arthrobacter oryzae TaxID=409290 RepID=A0A3N0C013_9MICC|nr:MULTISPECIES: hypothetical protein [Arthrobacter]QYF90719.1 hypothetical protein KY499_05485 [Arthrobacter sp. PAMC25284]RNL55012.1 hypothetical protein D7003_10550 [Arthrobacter oryzae]
MSKFLVLYTSDASLEEQMQQSSDGGATEMQEWMAWGEKTGSALLDFGAPVHNARHVGSAGVQAPGAKVTGYSFVEAADADAAAALFADHPHLQIGDIEILETVNMSPG